MQWQQPHAWKQLEGVERLWATSDLHVEHESNLAFLRGLDGYSEDGLIVAGDVCSSIALLRSTMALLVGKFKHVFYCAGNHELWHDPATDGADSFGKLLAIYEMVTDLGAHAAPALLGGGGGAEPQLAVVPLQSWHHCNFLAGGPVADMPSDHPLRQMDGSCRWPAAVARCSTSAGVARLFARCNEELLRQAVGTEEGAVAAARGHSVVSFSHFLPRPELHRTHPSALADRLG